MPKGNTHLAWELGLFPLVLAGGFALGLGMELLPLGLGYLLGSLFLSPDLDLLHSRPARRWGPLRFLWWPYARLFRHRGLSHHPFLGPLTRFLYLGLWLLSLSFLLGFALPPFRLSWALSGLVGLWIPQFLHVFLDRFLAGKRV